MPAIDFVRKIDLVSAAAIVIRAARAHGEAQRHRLQRARLVAGNLEALDLRRERDAVVADRLGRAPASLRQQIADALAAADQLDRAQHRVAAPNVSQGSSSHPRSTHSIAKAIVPPALIVSMPSSSHSLDGAQHGVRIADAAQRAEREQAFVFQPDAVVICRVQ